MPIGFILHYYNLYLKSQIKNLVSFSRNNQCIKSQVILHLLKINQYCSPKIQKDPWSQMMSTFLKQPHKNLSVNRLVNQWPPEVKKTQINRCIYTIPNNNKKVYEWFRWYKFEYKIRKWTVTSWIPLWGLDICDPVNHGAVRNGGFGLNKINLYI